MTGYPGELDSDDVTGKVVHTAMERRGEFTCSNEDLNQLQHNAVWGLRSNTHSIPEDCPQRDERFGWTGDAHISTRALLFNYDAVRFDEKWARDHDDVAAEMGYVTDVIPNKEVEDPADPTWSILIQRGNPALPVSDDWSDTVGTEERTGREGIAYALCDDLPATQLTTP